MSLAELQHKVMSNAPGAYAYKDRLWVVWHNGIAIGSSVRSEYDAWSRALERVAYRGSVTLPVC